MKGDSDDGESQTGDVDEALLQESAVIRLRQPNRARLGFLATWMQDVRMGYVHLIGSDSDIWSQPNILDMVSLQPPSADDLFTTWISETAIPAFHRALEILHCKRSYVINQSSEKELTT